MNQLQTIYKHIFFVNVNPSLSHCSLFTVTPTSSIFHFSLPLPYGVLIKYCFCASTHPVYHYPGVVEILCPKCPPNTLETLTIFDLILNNHQPNRYNIRSCWRFYYFSLFLFLFNIFYRYIS